MTRALDALDSKAEYSGGSSDHAGEFEVKMDKVVIGNSINLPTNNDLAKIPVHYPGFLPHQVMMQDVPFPPCAPLIGPKTFSGISNCPCCNRSSLEERDVRETLDDEPSISQSSSEGSMKSLLDDDENDEDESQHMFPDGLLPSGVEYRPKRILAEGWVHKKGTGNDIWGSRAWKPRWARLTLAKVEGYEVDVPLLLIYWYSSSETPSTIIMLDSTVVLPFDRADKKDWNAYCFNIVHAKTSDKGKEVTRTFTAPEGGRNAWVSAINKALFDYSKAQSKAKKQTMHGNRPLSPTPQFASKFEDKYVSQKLTSGTLPLPPSSPRAPEKRPLPRAPRNDALMGESLVLS